MPNVDNSGAILFAQSYLNEIGFEEIPPENSGEFAMRGKIEAGNTHEDVVIIFDKHFPSTYPKVYAIDHPDVYSLPHINHPKTYGELTINEICFAVEREKVYRKSPVDLVHHCINRAESLLSDLYSGTFDNKVKLFDEFDSYWKRTYRDLFLFIKEGIEGNGYLTFMELRGLGADGQDQQLAIVTDSMSDVKSFANRNGYTIVQSGLSPYVDVKEHMTLPLPQNHGDILDLLQRSRCDKFLKKNTKLGKVLDTLIISFNMPDGSTHCVTVKYDSRFLSVNPSTPYQGGYVKSINRDWLMKRGGNETMSKHTLSKKNIAIVGCGSIGSNLAFKLCKSGVGDMTLIDPSLLTSANVGRHLLGMNGVWGNKAESTAHSLSLQFIGTNIHGLNKKSQDVIDMLKEMDLIVVAIGSDDPSAEGQIAELCRSGELPPSLFLWFEAEAIAGHSVYVDSSTPLSMEAISDEIELLQPNYASSLVASEVGCNSDYMPYSHLDADWHINTMARNVLALLRGDSLAMAISTYITPIRSDEYHRYKVPDNRIKRWTSEDFFV